jgi:serine/threonine protein phosphatase PrpC
MAAPPVAAASGAGKKPIALRCDIAQASDPGRDPNKQVNEDSCGFAETRFGHLCVLCDGMGGHYGGQEASRRAVTTIFESIERMPETMTPSQALKASVEEAARRVYELGGAVDNKVRPGSTVVALLLHDAGLDVAHVGDSRAYIIRSNQIYPLTRDHSMVQGLIDAGYITEEQAIGHPDSNKITRALGMKPEVDVEVRPEPMELFPGDLLMQSSDGLTDLALAPDILAATRQALSSGDLTFACNQLVRLANDRGGHDNITVQMVRVTQVPPKVGATIAGAPAGAQHSAPGIAPTRAGAPATVAPTVPGGTSQPTQLDEGETHYMGRSPAAGMPLAGGAQGSPGVGPTWGAGGTPPPAPAQNTPPPASARSAGLQAYQVGSPQHLPLPPATAGSHVAPTLGPSMGGQQVPQHALATGSLSPHVMQSGQGMGGGQPGLLAGVGYPVPLARPYSQKRKSHIVYLVLGLSILVAILLVLLLWALFLR